MKAGIINALIRCTRDDLLAQGAFQCVREGLNIWVRELPEDVDEIFNDLTKLQPLLKKLGQGSLDYTLHIAVASDHDHALSLPPDFSVLAGDCGFNIELVTAL